jgi:very-short-patch-repair endonuclease
LQLQELEANRIVARLLRERVPPGIKHGPSSNRTDGALIKNELGKQRRHLPIRTLISRASAALQTLKPVWLMSPSAVAQHIEPETLTFDLVIIDEASQMEPEFAIGAIARAAQLVVVGDPMQLPPTPFFKIGADDDEDEDEDYGGDAESILDLAFARFPDTRRLKWHYRSRHASLIAHSNREFYNSGLVVFPNSTMNDPLLGVKHVYVGGTYQNKMNEEEARAVIEAATGLMYTRPELSIGIVTMNASQRELIFRQFERAAADDATVRAYMDRHEPTIERFFVKNLENVQGDERDIIIISTLYGPAPGTRAVLQRFGPINSATGHRRLNVLFTRAKRSTMVFTSLEPSDIVIGEKSSKGVKALRRFLDYAAGGAVVDDANGGEPESDFEVFVADRLRAAGYEAVPQVGVEGFRIDLGVRHSDYPNGFIAGIECDGATYHSGLTIRDRDRIRQDVLEGLGWRIYRVWSTDWFNDCERETDKLLRWLGEQREAASARARVEQVFTTPAPSLDPDEEPGQFAADEPADPDEDPVVVAEAEEAAPAAVNAADEPTRAESEAEYDPEAGEEARPDIPVVRPEGRKRTLDERIDYYELAPGYYEVWIDDHPVGKVTRLNVGLAPTDFRSRPQFRAEVYASGEMLNYEDIYVAVRAVARLAGARSPAPAAE